MGFTVLPERPTKYGIALANQFVTIKGHHQDVSKFYDQSGTKKWTTSTTYHVYASTDQTKAPLYMGRVKVEFVGADPPAAKTWQTLLYKQIKTEVFSDCTDEDFVDDNV